jgi:protocatechuate 3,4-dioxygenase beta subunit
MLNRRQSLYLLTGATAASVFAASRLFPITDNGILTPEQEQGPFYLPKERIRRDVREDGPGLPLQLSIALVDAIKKVPVVGAAVDIWHCDASGLYSGFQAMAMHGPGNHDHGPGDHGPDGLNTPSDKATFCRGVQMTDDKGVASFMTIYPGWYQGREIHIHVKVHLAGAEEQSAYEGGHVCHTGQIFFPDETNEAVSLMQPYASSKTPRTTKSTDHVYRWQSGIRSVATISPLSSDPLAGYAANLTMEVDPAASPKPVGFGLF